MIRGVLFASVVLAVATTAGFAATFTVFIQNGSTAKLTKLNLRQGEVVSFSAIGSTPLQVIVKLPDGVCRAAFRATWDNGRTGEKNSDLCKYGWITLSPN